MKTFTIVSGLLFLLALTGCQTTSSEDTANASEEANNTPAATKANTNLAAIPGYRPVDGEKFTYALVNTDKIPHKQLRVFQEAIENGLEAGDKLTEDSAAAKHVEVLFTSYRMRSPGTRFVFGAMAGKDRIETMVHIKDAGSGEILHSQFYRTRSSTGFRGIGTVLKKHARKVVAYVVDGRKGRHPGDTIK